MRAPQALIYSPLTAVHHFVQITTENFLFRIRRRFDDVVVTGNDVTAAFRFAFA